MGELVCRTSPYLSRVISLPPNQPARGTIMRAIAKTFLLLLVAGLQQSASAQSRACYNFTRETQLFIDGTSCLHDWTCEVPKTTGSFTTG